MQVIDYFACDRPEFWLEKIMYTFPEYRGHRYSGKLFLEAERLARAEQVHDIYISTNHDGLYEKYGCEFYQVMTDMHGEPSRVYRMHVD